MGRGRGGYATGRGMTAGAGARDSAAGTSGDSGKREREPDDTPVLGLHGFNWTWNRSSRHDSIPPAFPRAKNNFCL